jgi:hypothetical protein
LPPCISSTAFEIGASGNPHKALESFASPFPPLPSVP